MIVYQSGLVAIAVDPETNCAACALAPSSSNVPDPLYDDSRGVVDAALDDALNWAAANRIVPACDEAGAWLSEPDLASGWRLFDCYRVPTLPQVAPLDVLGASMSALRDELEEAVLTQWSRSH